LLWIASSLALSADGQQLLSRLATAVENLFAPTVSLAEQILRSIPSRSSESLKVGLAHSAAWAPGPYLSLNSMCSRMLYGHSGVENSSFGITECQRLDNRGSELCSSYDLPVTTQVASIDGTMVPRPVCSGQQWDSTLSCMQATVTSSDNASNFCLFAGKCIYAYCIQ